MKISKSLIAITLAVAGIFANASAVTARSLVLPDAIATVSLNVRAGPSTRFNVIDTLFAGEQVFIRQCRQGWCSIYHAGPDGWVAERYLRTNTPSQPDYPITPPPGYPWPSAPAPTPPSPWPFVTPPGNLFNKACFYKGRNYTGDSICVHSGRNFEHLGPRWNNKISSIRIYPGAQVTVCRNQNYNGFCRTSRLSWPFLGLRLNNAISSVHVN